MFVAREHELQVLEKLFTSDSFEMVVLYGRRRVGKMALIDEFVKDKTRAVLHGHTAKRQDES